LNSHLKNLSPLNRELSGQAAAKIKVPKDMGRGYGVSLTIAQALQSGEWP
jgi:hypothetical protein